MIRLAFAVFVGAVLVVVYDRASGTGWAPWLGAAAAVLGVLVTFVDDRDRRNLARWEANEARRLSRPSNQSRFLAGHHERGNR